MTTDGVTGPAASGTGVGSDVPTHDDLHRTVKLELEEGRADTVEEAERLAATYVLQIFVAADVAASPTRQAVLLTAVNAGARAFRGGIRITGHLDWPMIGGWGAGRLAADVVGLLGGTIVDGLEDHYPTIVVGHHDEDVPGQVVIRPTWNGWAAGVVTSEGSRRAEVIEHPVSGVAAGGLAVSEAFGHIRGSVAAGRRDIGMSLWRSDRSWAEPEAVGPALRYLPTRLWLLGLGHLGQAYLWTLGFLPYQDRSEVELWLQDFDRVVEANRSTGLLVDASTPAGMLKTRLGAAAMETLGFRTKLIERPFDEKVVPGASEPTWALGGLDGVEPRRHLGAFSFAVDMGLGAARDDYQGIRMHTFPAAGDATDVFRQRVAEFPQANAPVAGWAAKAADDPCGVVQIQNVAVGAAFVGAVAASFAVAEILRVLAGERATTVMSCTLSAIEHIDTVLAETAPPLNPGYQRAS